MNYLTPEEYPMYCKDASEFDVMFASRTIDAYVGKEFIVKNKKEIIKLDKRKKTRLSGLPMLSVENVTGIYKNKFGLSKEPLSSDSISIDEFGFVEFMGAKVNNFFVFGIRPEKLEIEYTYGYEEVPGDIKVVCGIIASNHARNQSMGGFSNAKQVSSLDFNVVLFDDKIMSSNERLILNKYKDV